MARWADRCLRFGVAAVAAGSVLLLAACGQEQPPAPSGSTPATGVTREPAAGAAAPGPVAPATEPRTGATTPSTGAPPPGATAQAARPGDSDKGRQIYLGQCAMCHNADPSRDGPVGPAVKGSSLDLLEARVLRGAYPSGYKPKRDSKVMPARPDLASTLPDLAAYLR